MPNVKFIHIPKTAGSSIKQCVKNRRMGAVCKKHSGIESFTKDPDDYIFCAVRNPYDRAVSLFYHFYKKHGLFTKKYNGCSVIDFYHKMHSDLVNGRAVFPRRRWVHWKPQSHFIVELGHENISPSIDKLLRYESLNDDWSEMVNEIASRFPRWGKAPAKLPHVNKSQRPQKSWQNLLDEKSIEAINLWFEDDFRLLDYDKL